MVESCGTSRLDFLQLDFSNLNSVFNIDIFVADLPGDNVDKIMALGDIKGIHSRLQLVSGSIPVVIPPGVVEMMYSRIIVYKK